MQPTIFKGKISPTMADTLTTVKRDFLKATLRPLCKFAVRNRFTLQHIIDLLKVLLIEEGAVAIEKNGEKVTASRLSLLTGVHRKDVAKIFKGNEEPIRKAPPLMTRVIGQWEQDKRFRTSNGQPRTLSLEDDKGGFYDLVRSVTDDINPSTVLNELERSGLIQRSGRGVKLVKQVFRVGTAPQARYDLLANNVETLILAAEENLFEPQKTMNVHFRTEYDNVFVSDLSKIRNWLFEEAKAFHKRAREYISQHDKDFEDSDESDPTKAGAQVVLSSFSFTTKK